MIPSRLDVDTSTVYVAQQMWKNNYGKDAEQTFILNNHSDVDISNAFRYAVEGTDETEIKGIELSNLLEKYREISFTEGEIEYLVARGVDSKFADYLKTQTLPEVSVETVKVEVPGTDGDTKAQLEITSKGSLHDLVFWGPLISSVIVEQVSYYQLSDSSRERMYLDGVATVKAKFDAIKDTDAKIILGGTSTKLDTDWMGAIYLLAVGFFSDIIVGTTNFAASFDFGLDAIDPKNVVQSRRLEDVSDVYASTPDDLVIAGNPKALDIWHIDSHLPGLTYLWDTDLFNDVGAIVPNLKWEEKK